MPAADPPETQPAAPQQAKPANGLDGVGRAGGEEAAGAGASGPQVLVADDQPMQQPGGAAHDRSAKRSKRIQHQTEIYSWEFLFLGAGEDAIATAAKMSIQAENSSRFVADAAGQHAAMASFSRKSIGTRARKSGHATAGQLADADAPLESIVREEDQKRR